MPSNRRETASRYVAQNVEVNRRSKSHVVDMARAAGVTASLKTLILELSELVGKFLLTKVSDQD